MKVNRSRFLISVIVIFQLTWLIFSFGLNGHFHQLDNNRIIYHTHPIATSEKHGDGWPHHHHFSFELVYYAQITRLLTDGWGISAVFLLFIGIVGRLNLIPFLKKKNVPLILIPARAPPFVSVEKITN